MKTMSIARYAQELDTATTRRARASLFVRSLTLRFKLWRTQRELDRRPRKA